MRFLPEFYLDIGERFIEIPPFEIKSIPNGRLDKAVQLYLARQKIKKDVRSFFPSLQRFYDELIQIQTQGFDILLTHAQKRGYLFLFHQARPNGQEVASFLPLDNALVLECPHYGQEERTFENILAHELTHGILNDVRYQTQFRDAIAHSAWGKTWFQLFQTFQRKEQAAFQTPNGHFSQNHESLKRVLKDINAGYQNILDIDLYRSSQPKNPHRRHISETICQLMGKMVRAPQGRLYYQDLPLCQMATDMVLKLALAYTKNGPAAYRVIAEKLDDFSLRRSLSNQVESYDKELYLFLKAHQNMLQDIKRQAFWSRQNQWVRETALVRA